MSLFLEIMGMFFILVILVIGLVVLSIGITILLFGIVDWWINREHWMRFLHAGRNWRFFEHDLGTMKQDVLISPCEYDWVDNKV